MKATLNLLRMMPALRGILIAIPLTMIPAQAVRAATLYWDGGTVSIGTTGNGASGGGAGNWSTNVSNWDQGTGLAHVAWTNGTNTASLGGTTAGTVTLISPVTLGGLTIGTVSYVIAGDATNRLSFSGAAVSINASAGTNSSINAPITTDAGSVLSITGGGPLANNALALGGSNNIQGNVTIASNSKILLANNGALSGATGITVPSGCSLGIGGGVTVSGVAATISGRTGNTSGGSAIQSSGIANWAGGVVLAADASAGARAGMLTISGDISETGGSRALSIDPNTDVYGAEVVQLSGNNSYSGGTKVVNSASILSFLTTSAKPASGTTTVPAGAALALGIGGAGNFTTADIDSLFANTLANVSLNATSRVGIDTTPGDFTYPSSVSATRGLIKVGANALMLSGNNTYTGSTMVWSGTLKLGSAGCLGDGTNNTSGVIVNTGATLDLNGTSATAAAGLTLNGTGVSSGALANSSATAASYGGLVTLGSAASIIAGTGDITLANTGTITGSGFGLTVGGAKNTAINGIIGTGSGTLAKQDAGKLTLTGANTYTGTTSISGGTLVNGSATTFAAKGALSLSSTGTFDLGGYNASVTSVTAGAATNSITNNGVSPATLTIAAQTNVSVALLIKDGTSPTSVSMADPNLSVNSFTNTNNSFSGGLTLLNSAVGTRLTIVSLTDTGAPGAITKGNYGTGTITVGQSATDKASIFFTSGNNLNLMNAVTVNTALGTDRYGNRVDTSGILWSGTLTANLADAAFSSNANASADLSLTGQVTGPKGLILDVSQSSGTATAFTVKLNNATANPNNYQGDTVVNRTGQAGKSATLTLGAANQIPNGANAGNVTVNGSLGTGTLNLAGYDETINGLGGNGVVDNLTAANANNTLTLGDNNATGTEFSGIIRNTLGTLAITKTGTGTQTLSGANTYTGNTTVNAGTLELSATGGLKFAPAANGVSNRISGAGTVVLRGTLVIDLGAAAVANGNSWVLVDAATLPATTFDSAGFSVDGFAKSGASWIKTDGSNTWTFSQTTGVLTLSVAAATGYADWASANAPGETASQYHNNNGVPNGVAYFMGATAGYGANPGYTANPAILAGAVTWPKSPAFSGTYQVQTSSDLTHWSPAASGVVDNGTSVVYTVSAGPGEKLFVRISVTPN